MDINLLGAIWKASREVEDKNTTASIAYLQDKTLLYLLDLFDLVHKDMKRRLN